VIVAMMVTCRSQISSIVLNHEAGPLTHLFAAERSLQVNQDHISAPDIELVNWQAG
jgi:hypothetical protein